MAALLIGTELGKGVANMVYQLSPSGDIDYTSHTKQVQKIEGDDYKGDCAGIDLDYMKEFAKTHFCHTSQKCHGVTSRR